jgi:hypothetical protein
MRGNDPRARARLDRRGGRAGGEEAALPPPRPCCGARTRAGAPCGPPGLANGRCRAHGGLSTGPRTPEGLARMRRAKTRHGLYSGEVLALRRAVRAVRSAARALRAGSAAASAPEVRDGQRPDQDPRPEDLHDRLLTGPAGG